MIAPRFLSPTLVVMLAGCAAQTATIAPPATPSPAVAAPAPPVLLGLADPASDPMRWTYGSGEAAGASIQAWRALADYAIAAAAKKPGPVKKARPVKKAGTGKKAGPLKKASPVKKSAPAKTAEEEPRGISE